MDKKCPYLHSNTERPEKKDNLSVDTETGLKYPHVPEKCPFGEQKTPLISPVGKNESFKKEDSDSEDEPMGGCPVMHKGSKDPKEKEFEYHYELPKFRPFDFFFELKGGLSEQEFREKTVKLRAMPAHLLYTIFQNDEKLNNLRKKEFPMLFFVFDDIKNKANKMFKKGLYKDAYELYCTVTF